jgi:hypothetical protein
MRKVDKAQPRSEVGEVDPSGVEEARLLAELKIELNRKVKLTKTIYRTKIKQKKLKMFLFFGRFPLNKIKIF